MKSIHEIDQKAAALYTDIQYDSPDNYPAYIEKEYMELAAAVVKFRAAICEFRRADANTRP